MDREIKNKFIHLFDDYADGLPEKIQMVEKLIAPLQAHCEKEAFADFYRKVHSLHGSAGVYGFVELKEAADQLEAYLKPFFSGAEKLADVNFEKILLGILHLKETLKKTQREKALSIFLKSNIINNDGDKDEKNSNH